MKTLTRALAAVAVLMALALLAPKAFAAEQIVCKALSTSSTELVWQNANRKFLWIGNTNATAANFAVVSTTCPATATNGFPVAALGEIYREGQDVAGKRWCAIAAAGTPTLCWQEGVIYGGPTQSPSPTPVPTPTP